jgi:hypothetical protein
LPSVCLLAMLGAFFAFAVFKKEYRNGITYVGSHVRLIIVRGDRRFADDSNDGGEMPVRYSSKHRRACLRRTKITCCTMMQCRNAGTSSDCFTVSAGGCVLPHTFQ